MAPEAVKNEGEPMAKQTLAALGICAKAGRLITGTPLICEALKGRQKPLVVLAASDNSQNTEKRLADKCAFYNIKLLRLSADGEALAHAVGKSGRVAAVAVTDVQLCRLVCGKFESEHNL